MWTEIHSAGYIIWWKGYLFETNVVGSFFIHLIFCNVSPSTWK
jgi:hypothetical protein